MNSLIPRVLEVVMRHPRITWHPFLVAASAVIACSRTNDLPKTPLGQAAAAADTTAGERSLQPAARTALDRGNEQFRAKKYDAALESYREAARNASGDAAPYFGIFMAAQKLGKTSLADSASMLIQVLSGTGGGLSDSAMQKVHAGLSKNQTR
jgi:hypothetical protein